MRHPHLLQLPARGLVAQNRKMSPQTVETCSPAAPLTCKHTCVHTQVHSASMHAQAGMQASTCMHAQARLHMHAGVYTCMRVHTVQACTHKHS